ncbi:MAG: MFS transporter, partial [Lentisphaeria bacterium]|nr:MFS transporter [Lentisphaeria bacterium]
LYIDGVGTIMFAAAPLATGLKISTQYLLITILGLQFLGLPFTLLFGKLAQKFSARAMICTGIIIYAVVSILAGIMSAVQSLAVRQMLFVAIAFLVGTAQGGIQSLSRSLFSRLIPPERAAELFSVYNIFGRFTTIIGPLMMIPLATWLWGKAELGITLMLIPAAIGFILLRKVEIPGE